MLQQDVSLHLSVPRSALVLMQYDELLLALPANSFGSPVALMAFMLVQTSMTATLDVVTSTLALLALAWLSMGWEWMAWKRLNTNLQAGQVTTICSKGSVYCSE